MKLNYTISSPNYSVIAAVAIVCSAAMILSFSRLHSLADRAIAADTTPVVDTHFDELDYYNQVADEYLPTLPADKALIARMVDEDNHYLFYYEKGDIPSCYIFDLETLTTSVLFGSEKGFRCDTTLVLAGRIQDWRRNGNMVTFVATNRASDAGYINAELVFSVNLVTRELFFIANGADAYFPDNYHVTVNKAKLNYHSVYSGEDVYIKTPYTYTLVQ